MLHSSRLQFILVFTGFEEPDVYKHLSGWDSRRLISQGEPYV